MSRHVWLVDTHALGYRATVAAYLVGGAKRVLLVDTGYSSTARELIRVVAGALKGRKLVVFPTHVHLDHCGGAADIVDAFDGAVVVAHRRAARHLRDPTRLVESTRQIYGDSFLREVGVPKPIPGDRVSEFSEEIELDLGGVTVRGLYTPGHAPHHSSVYVEADRVIITGDAVSSRVPAAKGLVIPATPPPSFDLHEAEKSLDKLASLGARIAALAHFGPLAVWENYFEEEKMEMRRWLELVWRTYKESGCDEGEALSRIASGIAAKLGVENLPPYLLGTVYVSFAGALGYLRKREGRSQPGMLDRPSK